MYWVIKNTRVSKLGGKMYIIVIYDVNVERVVKINKFLKSYLNWIQNSVFEGEISKSNYLKLKNGVRSIINEKKDAVMIYQLNTKKVMTREIIGIEKSEITNIL